MEDNDIEHFEGRLNSPNENKFKLFKNSKLYNWELQLVGRHPDKPEKDIDELERLNEIMKDKFGGSIKDDLFK